MEESITNLFDTIELFGVADTTSDIQFKGENRSGLVLLCRSSADVLPADEQEMLGKMLNALKLSWDDVALICTQENYQFSHLKRKIGFKKLVSFGFTPLQLRLNINADNFRLIDFSGAKIIFSESLSELKENKNNSKDHFWRAMKEMFASK